VVGIINGITSQALPECAFSAAARRMNDENPTKVSDQRAFTNRHYLLTSPNRVCNYNRATDILLPETTLPESLPLWQIPLERPLS